MGSVVGSVMGFYTTTTDPITAMDVAHTVAGTWLNDQHSQGISFLNRHDAGLTNIGHNYRKKWFKNWIYQNNFLIFFRSGFWRTILCSEFVKPWGEQLEGAALCIRQCVWSSDWLRNSWKFGICENSWNQVVNGLKSAALCMRRCVAGSENLHKLPGTL